MKLTKSLPRVVAVVVLTAAMVTGVASASSAAPAGHHVAPFQVAINTVSHCKNMEPGH